MPLERSTSDCEEMAPPRSFCWRWMSVRVVVARPLLVPPRWSPGGVPSGTLQPWSHAGRVLVTPHPRTPGGAASKGVVLRMFSRGVFMCVVLLTCIGVIEVTQHGPSEGTVWLK